MPHSPLPDALYYLRNFLTAIDWIVERNGDLLSSAEQEFAQRLSALPISAQALLVRLVMRSGDLFRRSKIRYTEIEPLDAAIGALIDIGWIDARPTLSLADVFRLTTQGERLHRFGESVRRMTKQCAFESLAERHAHTATFEQWLGTTEPVYRVTVAPIALQMRLLHFGNFYQQWHEYTLAHLQIFKYESVTLGADSRAFESRDDIEFFYAMHRCHQTFHDGAELVDVLALLPQPMATQGWLRRRWDRLRFQIGQVAEREEHADTALAMYNDNADPEARIRMVRLLERLGRANEAIDRARALLSEDRSEAVAQRVGRILARLERQLGRQPARRANPVTWPVQRLQLPPDPERRVEELVQEHLSTITTPVYYVENSLICSLFGLLCWEAIFQPVRGAFFHRFQAAPADLGCPGFVLSRQTTFASCLRELDTGHYATSILTRYAEKYGVSAPFVHWKRLDGSLLKLALDCIDAQHLKRYFARLLDNLSENATGLLDLVQFFPAQRTYRFIEVKGPGDRLQDHQRRWLQYAAGHQLPVEVCQVTWGEQPDLH